MEDSFKQMLAKWGFKPLDTRPRIQHPLAGPDEPDVPKPDIDSRAIARQILGHDQPKKDS